MEHLTPRRRPYSHHRIERERHPGLTDTGGPRCHGFPPKERTSGAETSTGTEKRAPSSGPAWSSPVVAEVTNGRGFGPSTTHAPVGTVAVHPSGSPDRDPQVCLRVDLHAVGVSLVDPGEDGPCHGFTGGRHLVGIDPALGAVGEVHACTVRGERGAVGDGVFVQDP